MLHNNLRRKQNRLDLLGLIIVGLLAGAFVTVLCYALFESTRNFVSSGRPTWLSLFFWAIFLCWQLFPIIVAGFGVSFEFHGTLSFPVSFCAFYLLGLTYALTSFIGLPSLLCLIAILLR